MAAAPEQAVLAGELIGVISGTVRDTGGTPIPNIPVFLNGPTSGANTCTGVDGTYQFTGVETEVDWRVEAFPFRPVNMCGGSLNYAHQLYNQQNAWNSANLIRLTTAVPAATGIDFALGPGGGISGHIYDADGAPVDEICVTAFSPAPFANEVANLYFTASDGSFAVYGIPAGTVYLQSNTGCNPSTQYQNEWYAIGGSTPLSAQATGVVVAAGGMATGIDFNLDLASWAIEGTITAAGTGEPISGASVFLMNSNYAQKGSTTTDSNGNYSFSSVDPGYYAVSARVNGYGASYYGGYDDPHRTLFHYDGVTPVSNIDIGLEVEGTITGCVYEQDGVTPIPFAALTAHPSHGGITLSAPAGSGGCYQIGGFATGDYLIYASAPGRQTLYYDHKLTWGTGTVLHMVSGQNKPNIKFNLPLAGSISGTVLRANGTVISDARIVVDATGTTPDTSGVRADVSRQDGTYMIDGLAPGLYKVSVNVMYTTGLVGGYYPDKRLSAEAQTLVVRAEENVPGINFNLGQDAPITGRLVDAVSGLPVNVSSAYVVAYDLNQNYRATAQVLPDGTFRIDGLEPGSYYLAYSVPGYARMLYDGVLDPAEATVVTTTTPGTVEALGDIQLSAGIAQSGHIYAEDGHTPIQGAWVRVLADYPFRIGRQAMTDENGAYTITDLAIGNYVMMVSAMGYADQFYLGGDTWDNATPFSITNNHPTAIDMSLDPAGVISGTVLDADGKPITDRTIYVKAIGTSIGTNEAEAQVGSDGTFTLSGLRNGSYNILANSRYAAAYASIYYDGQAIPEAATGFIIGDDFMSYTGVGFNLVRTEYTFTDEDEATSLAYTDQTNPDVKTVVNIPAGAVDQPTLFVYTPTDLTETQAGFQFAGVGFTLNAYQNETYLEEFQFGKPTRVELHYDPAALGGIAEADLALMYYNQDTRKWEDAACGAYERHPEADWLAVPICHLSNFGLFEKMFSVFLPTVSSLR